MVIASIDEYRDTASDECVHDSQVHDEQVEPESIALSEPKIDESRVAEAMIKHYGDDLCYVPERNHWFVWDGKRWDEDAEDLRVRRIAVRTARGIEKWVPTSELDDDTRRSLSASAISMGNAGRVSGVVKQARSVEGVAISDRDLDRNPWKLNVSNGTVNLRSGQLEPHNRGDLITQLADIEYNKFAPAPKWNTFLETVFHGDEELIGYVQRAVGYSLIGDPLERAFFITHGTGGNGKSIFFETLKEVFGDFVSAVNPEALLQHRFQRHPADIAMLHAKRMVYAQEPDKGKPLNEALIKALTGGDHLTTRRMRENPREFRPTFTIWISTNHLPGIESVGQAIRDRLRIIPFRVTIPDEDKRRRDLLLNEFQEEAPGILRWAIEGCIEYHERGMNPPSAVESAVSIFFYEMDVLSRFLDDCCAQDSTDPDCFSIPEQLYSAYAHWCGEQGEPVWSSTVFARNLKERGFASANKRVEGNQTRVRMGVKLRGAT